jgi:predicted Zn-dependent protease
MASTKKEQLAALLQSAIDSYRAGRLDQAIDVLVRNAKSFPNAARLWGYLGFLYAEASHDAKAAVAFSKAVSVSPHSEQASLGLFHSLWRMGRTNAAFDEMRRFARSNDSPSYRALLRDMLSEPPREPSAHAEVLVLTVLT